MRVRGCSAPDSGLIVSMHVGKHRGEEHWHDCGLNTELIMRYRLSHTKKYWHADKNREMKKSTELQGIVVYYITSSKGENPPKKSLLFTALVQNLVNT